MPKSKSTPKIKFLIFVLNLIYIFEINTIFVFCRFFFDKENSRLLDKFTSFGQLKIEHRKNYTLD